MDSPASFDCPASFDRPAGPADRVTVVVVSYNVAPLLERCLVSLRRARTELRAQGDDLVPVVVDNASSDGSAALVRDGFPEATLLANPRNLGFGAACNQGAAAGGRGPVLFLNPDAEVTPGALPALLDRLRRTPRAAVVGPRLVHADGRPQPNRRRFPTLGVLLLESTPLEWRRPGWDALRHYRAADLPETAGAVDWLSGACLLVREAAFEEVAGFAPPFFMYFEEVDLARRLAGRGWEIWYEPAATVIHHSSRSADQDVGARDRSYYGSKYRYVARYWGPAVARGLRLAGGTVFAAEWAAQALRRDPALTRRYGALTRWHFGRERPPLR
jgi:N-acetylglucosaminyl-diphospho-decaprenol L-rhamnosyltransferase